MAEDILNGLRKGRRGHVRVVKNDEELLALYDDLALGAVPFDRPTHSGTWVIRPDGVRVGLRPASKSGGRTIDVEFPGASENIKVHIE